MEQDPFDISNKRVLVTGGTRGLGRAISSHLASQGAKVFAGYFQNDAAATSLSEETEAKGFRCSCIRANLMTSSGVHSLSEAVIGICGKVDAFVHCAATGVHKPLELLRQRDLMAVWQVNVGAFFELSLRLRPQMPRGSRIVAVSSEGAQRAISSYGSVGSSKGALEALCRQMAVEWASQGISVNSIAPGLLETDALTVWEDAEARVNAEIKASPLGRLVTLEEVARLVHFLCSEASEGIIGQSIRIDGGKTIKG